MDVWYFPSELTVVLFGSSAISAQLSTWSKCSVLKSLVLLETKQQAPFKLPLLANYITIVGVEVSMLVRCLEACSPGKHTHTYLYFSHIGALHD